jgi:hypothetical protein
MESIVNEISRIYPSLAQRLACLPEQELSDSSSMMELGSQVVELFEAGRVTEIPPAFEFAERLVVDGTESERHAAIIGFLETVQNVASHRACGASAFEQFLGPESVKAWRELHEAWRGKSSVAEILASETGALIQPKWWHFWRRRRRRTPRQLLDEVHDPELRKIIEQSTRE